MSNMLTYTTNGNIMIQEWEVFGILSGGDPYEMDGLGEDSTTALIENVKPGIFVPDTIIKVADENSPLAYEGIEITDAALMEPTEEFWYRWNFDDGLGPGPWIYKGTMSPPPVNVLLLHTWGTEANDCIAGFQSELETRGFKYYTLDDYNWGPTGTNINPSLAYMQDYDVIVVSINYYIFDQPKLDDMGNKLADYSDGGGGVIQMTFAAGSLYYSNIAGRWSAEDYNPIRYAANHYGYVTMGDVYDPTHPIMDEVSDVNCYYKHGASRETTGATRLVDYANGMVLCAYTNENYHTPGGGRIAGVNFFPWPQYSGGDAMKLAMNSVVWAWGKEIPTPVIPTVYKTFKDNGIYDVDLQVIDDDMGWDWIIGGGSAQPTPAPGQVPTISNNHMIVEVLNTDPVITPRIRAYVELDLSLRMSGNKHNTATMRLIENGDKIGEVTVYRDPGSPDIGVLSGTLEMTKDYDYKLEIEYDPDDLAGANPTWIFSAHWPDGKFKELKHTFNSNDPSDRVWTIDNLKSMMLGHDVIFEAEASDEGSDDLAFVWNFGDSTPFGVHIYANADPDVLNGVSDEATVIFDQDPDRDAWFDRGLNDIRSPFGTSISVKDSISHVFDVGQPYYYYVTLTVMDDDVGDGYPSTFNNDGGYDMEFVEINLG
jgi:hypothetical protein